MLADRGFASTGTWTSTWTWTWTRTLRLIALVVVGFVAGATLGIAGL